ncbi:hypothetical protein [Haloarcula amylovorans]|uniref:hypothetical protein n=1 Tax=Haloarcula amylovorans TaxID=2562280 RepID=UPI0010761F33|nr:hypothetical protein [Halomicroarcula amylolytica]
MARRSRIAALALLLPLLALIAVVVEVVSYLSLKRYGEGIDGMPTVAWEEFPEIDRELLGKFSSFDSELGWCPQAGVQKQKDTGDHLPGEEVEHVVTYSMDEYGSRTCVNDRDPDNDPTISTYGDSYCFCREVDDDETFQNYLARRLDTHVANYGAGNYGLDQALLRLKRQYDEDPTDYVVMTVTASSIGRILSVWKHYQEFGNVLAVKPRYELDDDGELELVESPIDEKEDLLDIESHASFLREHDYHYEHWFKPHTPSFPYSEDFLGEPENVRYAIYATLQQLERRYERSIPGVDTAERLRDTEVRMEQPRAAYHDRLFDEHDELFRALVGEFVSFAEEKEFTPVFAMVQQHRYTQYEQEHGAVYGDLLDRLDEEFDALQTIDVAQHLSTDDTESLYVQRGEGGHYSPETNERIAELLDEKLFGTEQESPQPAD